MIDAFEEGVVMRKGLRGGGVWFGVPAMSLAPLNLKTEMAEGESAAVIGAKHEAIFMHFLFEP